MTQEYRDLGYRGLYNHRATLIGSFFIGVLLFGVHIGGPLFSYFRKPPYSGFGLRVLGFEHIGYTRA